MDYIFSTPLDTFHCLLTMYNLASVYSPAWMPAQGSEICKPWYRTFMINFFINMNGLYNFCVACYKVVATYRDHFSVFVCLSVCLSVSLSDCHKTCPGYMYYWCNFIRTLQEWLESSLVVHTFNILWFTDFCKSYDPLMLFLVDWSWAELWPLNEKCFFLWYPPNFQCSEHHLFGNSALKKHKNIHSKLHLQQNCPITPEMVISRWHMWSLITIVIKWCQQRSCILITFQ